MAKVGDTIRIIHLDDPFTVYNGRVGVITEIIDCLGKVRYNGTWGSIGVFPFDGDTIEIVENPQDKI